MAARNAGAKRQTFSGRARVALRIGASALLLAAVILLVALYGAKPALRVSPEEAAAARAGSEYQSGLAALSSGDTTKGVALLQQSAADGSAAAASKLAAVTASSPAPVVTGTGTGATSSRSTTAAASGTLAPGIYASHVADLSSVVPTSFTGYTEREVTTDTSEYSVPLEPTRSGPYYGKVRLATITISDFGSAAKATSFVTGMKKAYAKDFTTAKAGFATGRFGTDGAQIAAFRFSRGRYAVEVVVTSSGMAPIKLKSEALALASLLPASR
jgi:hypothetical protein